MTRTEHLDDVALLARFRDTCAAVEQATTVHPPALAELLDAPATVTQLPVARRSHKFTAVALSLAAALGVGALWLGGGPQRVDTLAGFTATLVHAAHGAPLPKGFALAEIGTDLLTYRSGSRSFTVRTTIDNSLIEGPLTVRGGRPTELSIDPAAARIAWTERPGLNVTIDATGAWTQDELVARAESTMMLSARAWTEATSHGGFTQLEREDDDDRFTYRSLAPLTAGKRHPQRSLTGSLQAGVSLMFDGSLGFQAAQTFERGIGYGDSDHWLLIAAPGDARIEVARVGDGEVVATLTPVCDPGAPAFCFAVAGRIGEVPNATSLYRAKYYDAAGTLAAEVKF